MRIDSGHASARFDKPLALNDAFAIEFWFRPDTIPNPGFVPVFSLILKRSTGSEHSLWTALRNGEAAFGCYPGGGYSGQSVRLDGKEWCHLSAVYSQGGAKLELTASVRGKAAEKRTLSYESRLFTDSVTCHGLDLGASTQLFVTSLDARRAFADLRLWDRGRTPEDIAASQLARLVGNEPGLAGYWMLDEAEGDTFYDSSANDNDGRRITYGYEWERDSGLALVVGWVDDGRGEYLTDGKSDYLASKQIDYLQSKEQRVNEHHSKLAADRRTLAAAVEGKTKVELAAQRSVDERKERNDRAVAEREKALEKRRAEIGQLEKDQLARIDASSKIHLGEFIERLEEDIERSRSRISTNYGRVYGLDDVGMDLRMIPGYGGVGLHLPDPQKRTDPARLSTLTVKFTARRREESIEPASASVPRLEGTTELFARRKLAEAGFKADAVYEAVDERSGQHGRVLRQIYTGIEQGKAKLGSVIGLVIGRRT